MAIVAGLIGGLRELTLAITAEGISVFAVFYIVTQAIERGLEPIASSSKFHGEELELAKADLAAAREGTDGELIRAARLHVDRLQANRKVDMWMIASVVALAVAAALDLGLISAVVDSPDEDKFIFGALDVIVTGLAIGAGTQPLHDLISRLESAKKEADPATKPEAGTGEP